jgi:hypothetical protein
LISGLVLFFEKYSCSPQHHASKHPAGLSGITRTNINESIPHPATNTGFLDNKNLSLNPPVKIPATDLNDTSLNFQRDLPSGSFEELQPRPGDAPKPALTVADRKLNYELLGSKGFALELNLTPVYLNREAIIPERLVPGLGISIKF